TISGVPGEITVECGAVPTGAAMLPASDACDGGVTKATLNTDAVTPGDCPGRSTIDRSWTATDSCGNSSTVHQTIHVVDSHGPTISGVPSEITVECDAVPAGAATLPASDGCDGGVSAATLNTDAVTAGDCPARYTIDRSWTATDACGNASAVHQTIHVADTTKPVITLNGPSGPVVHGQCQSGRFV